jgi:hypothetical protein
VIDTNLAWFQSMGEFATSMADLELAVGAPLDKEIDGTQEQPQAATPEATR